MCGIAGFLQGPASKPLLHSQIDLWMKGMSDAIRHRGPDAFACKSFRQNTVHFVHRRLAIVDLTPTGLQTMTSHSGRFEIVFNGEIYNFLELKQKLDPVSWRGSSDTEILLQAFDRWGVEQSLTLCHGMFTMGIFDHQEDLFYLVRDRFGEKPLYYSFQNGYLAFASELKALKKLPFLRFQKDDESLRQFLAYGYIPSERSAYEQIQKLTPGTLIKLNLKTWQQDQKAYYQLKDQIPKQRRNLSFDEATDCLDQLLQKTIQQQMMADVPLGSFLSGGIDSSLVTAIMQAKSSKPVRSFTIGFDFDQYNEAPHAAKIAQHLGTEHTELMVTGKDCLQWVDHLSDVYDEPFADSSQIPSLMISKLTRQHVTVCLTGDGGDEVFGGYNRYSLVPSMKNVFRCPSFLLKAFRRMGQLLSVDQWDQVLAFMSGKSHGLSGDRLYKLFSAMGASDEMDLYHRLTRQWQHEDPLLISSENSKWGDQKIFKDFREDPVFQSLDLIEKMMLADTLSYMVNDVLVKVDRATMQSALESRAPFLDHQIVEFAWSLPLEFKVQGSSKKKILRHLLKRYVPAELFERPKVGFSIPLEHWLRKDLRTWAEDLLSVDSMKKTGADQWIHQEYIQNIWKQHLSGTTPSQHRLWNVLMLQQWLLQGSRT